MKPFPGLTFVGSALLAAMLCTAPLTSMAQRHGRGDHGGHGWHGDIRHFEHHDAGRWHSGGWRHSYHGGRLGWWWVVGGLWYFYPQPVYPYPDPYRPPVVVVEQAPAPVVVQMPPQAAPAPAPSQTPNYWYYCEAAQGYYPYVPSCSSGWSKVPATPPGVTP